MYITSPIFQIKKKINKKLREIINFRLWPFMGRHSVIGYRQRFSTVNLACLF